MASNLGDEGEPAYGGTLASQEEQAEEQERGRGWYVVHATVHIPPESEPRPVGHRAAGESHSVDEGYAASSEREARMVARHHIARKYGVSTANVHIDSVERQ